MATKAKIGVLGASGYTGAETVRLLLVHPRVEIALLTADRRAGQEMRTVFPQFSPYALPKLVSLDSLDWAQAALDLVKGEPFSGVMSSQFFEWVASEHLDFVLSAKAVDVAQELAELAFEAGDTGTVLWAVEKGLQLEPTREEMFRLWMHTLGQAGRAAKVDEVYRRLKLVLRQRIHPLHEPQPETREVWRRYTSMEVAGT